MVCTMCRSRNRTRPPSTSIPESGEGPLVTTIRLDVRIGFTEVTLVVFLKNRKSVRVSHKETRMQKGRDREKE